MQASQQTLDGCLDTGDADGEEEAENLELLEFDGSRNYDYATPYVTVSTDCTVENKCELNRKPIVSHTRHESLYWHPSSEEEELMLELRKLNLKMFEESELEYV